MVTDIIIYEYKPNDNIVAILSPMRIYRTSLKIIDVLFYVEFLMLRFILPGFFTSI